VGDTAVSVTEEVARTERRDVGSVALGTNADEGSIATHATTNKTMRFITSSGPTFELVQAKCNLLFVSGFWREG